MLEYPTNKGVNIMEYGIKDSDIFITNETKGILLDNFRSLNLTEDELACLLHMSEYKVEKSSNWHEYQGDMWYLKRRNNMLNIINELLGEYLSLYMNLPSIRHLLLLDKNRIIGVVSKNFREKDVEYVKANCLDYDEHKRINKILLSRSTIFNKSRKREMYNYIIRNFYANQCDRMHNVLCYYKFKGIYLAPLYDYEMSFISSSDDRIIDPYFMGIDITASFLSRLLNFDANMESSVSKIMDFDMKKSLGYLEEQYKIIIPDDMRKYYIDFDVDRKKIIDEKILGRR